MMERKQLEADKQLLTNMKKKKIKELQGIENEH